MCCGARVGKGAVSSAGGGRFGEEGVACRSRSGQEGERKAKEGGEEVEGVTGRVEMQVRLRGGGPSRVGEMGLG